ncbi:nucleotidyltransferase domain-containing protein [Candidatus Woesearchaeota archaeon]|nr:nucleotidyltransferase domain-containing protein [Candidatus Woesearchaeota archaeon]
MHGVTKAAVFGSFARGEAGKRSDIDILECIVRIEE